MRKREIAASGKVNSNGQLSLFMGEVNEFLKQWKNAKIVVRFIVSNPENSEPLKAYYYHYVVPTMRRAIWENGERKTESETELFLRELSPITQEQTPIIETGKYSTRVREICELSNAEFVEHIDIIKQIAAEEYSTFIDDPRNI